MANDKKPKEPYNSFTVDSDTTGIQEMPSVTKLLNRKSLNLSKLSKGASKEKTKSTEAPVAPVASVASVPPPPAQRPAAVEVVDLSKMPKITHPPNQSLPPRDPVADAALPAAPAAPLALKSDEIMVSSVQTGEIQLEQRPGDSPRPQSQQEPTSSGAVPPPSSPARVQQAARGNRRDANRIALWTPQLLGAGADPLGKGILHLLAKGAKQVLFLSISSPSPGSNVPIFASTAAIAPQAQLRLWTGLKWDPKVVPETWNQFVRAGHVELVPAGTTTDIKSSRNVVRAAFGIEAQDFLLLVRAGPATSCRGIVALISQKSLVAHLSEALPLLQAPAPKASAA